MEFLVDNVAVILILLFAGCLAGLLAGLFGIGGGVVVVPVIFFLLRGLETDSALSMSIAVTTSLACIVPTALSSISAHHKLDNIDWQLVKRLGLPLLLGVVVGSQLIAHLRSRGFVIFFGVFLLLLAANIIWRGDRKIHLSQLPIGWIQAVVASCVGGVSTVAGVGGGALGVPLLTAGNVPVHKAIGSCAVFGLLVSVVGATGVMMTAVTPAEAPPGTWKLIYLPGFFALVPLTVLMAPYGARLGKRLDPTLLRRLFAGVLMAAGARILYSGWTG